jgi:hypothetical protein
MNYNSLAILNKHQQGSGTMNLLHWLRDRWDGEVEDDAGRYGDLTQHELNLLDEADEAQDADLAGAGLGERFDTTWNVNTGEGTLMVNGLADPALPFWNETWRDDVADETMLAHLLGA